jgi:hypothetical protein
MNASEERDLPILTDVVELHTLVPQNPSHAATDESADADLQAAAALEALQADLVGRAVNLTDELLHNAARDMEGVLFERVLDRLRAALPEIVADALQEHLEPGRQRGQSPFP